MSIIVNTLTHENFESIQNLINNGNNRVEDFVMKRHWCFVGLLSGLMLSSSAKADPKGELVKAIVDQCKLPKEKAESLATPGRTGTTVQFTVCASSPIDVGEGCKVTCKKQGSNIGG